MIIKKMKLKNWKNFQDAEMTFTERVFIVGPNAAGKSNLLDAIRFLRDIAKKGGGFQYAIESRGGMSKIRCLSSEKHADVTMEIRLAENERQPIDWIYRLSFNDDIKTVSESEELLIAARGLKIMPEAVITEEKAWRRKTGGWVLERTPDSQEEDSETVKSTLLEQPSSNKAFRDISNFLRNAEYLHVIPQLIRDADSYYLKKGKEDLRKKPDAKDCKHPGS
jgi:predicted ATPase